jgi:hypothetical protein
MKDLRFISSGESPVELEKDIIITLVLIMRFAQFGLRRTAENRLLTATGADSHLNGNANDVTRILLAASFHEIKS